MSFEKQLIGQTLGGRYKLIRWIGGGGCADVYEAADIKFGNDRVAVKILKPEFKNRVAVEARIGRKFKHPNVVAVLDMIVDGETPFIVMEYLEGPTVDRLRPLSPQLLRKFVKDISAALQHAHEQGLVHRDLKMQNIILSDPQTSRQQFKILDFGIAAQVNAEMTLRNASMDGGGTIEYMPPEHLIKGGIKTDAKSDIYSFGIILYELLIGRRPFQAEGQNLMQTLKMIETAPPPRFSEIDPSRRIDSAVESLVLQCLSKSPERRPDSIKEVADRFLDCYEPDDQDTDDHGAIAPVRPAALQEFRERFSAQPESNPPLDMSLSMPPLGEPTAVPPKVSNGATAPHPSPKPQPQTPARPLSPPQPQQPAPAFQTLLPASDGGRPVANPTLLPAQPGQKLHTLKPGWNPTGTAPPPSPTRPPAELEQPPAGTRAGDGFSWFRNATLVVVPLLLLVIAVPIALQRHFALEHIQQLSANRQWEEAVVDLEAGNILSYPFIDRQQLLGQIHQDWIKDIQTLLQRGKLDAAIDGCLQLENNFGADPQATEILTGIADQVRKRINDFVLHDDYAEAIASFTGRSVGARLAKANGKLFDTAQEKRAILAAGLARLKVLSQQKKYVSVLKSGDKLQTEFPNDAALQTLLRRAQIGLLLEAGNLKLADGRWDDAAADYSAALAKNPEPDQWREVMLQRATAYQGLAAANLAIPPAQQVVPAEAERLLQPASLAIADVKEILTRHSPDPEAQKLRSQTYFLRAKFQHHLKNLPRAICDLKFALADDGTQTSALELLTAICLDEGEIGLQHHSKAHELHDKHLKIQRDPPTDADGNSATNSTAEAAKLTLEAEQEWQFAIEHLSLAIASCEAAIMSKGLAADGRILPLYYSRADARFRQMKPDYKGAVEDLKSFQKMASALGTSDAQVNLKCVQAMALQAWLQATCGDQSLRNPAEANQAALEAHRRFQAAHGLESKLDESQIRLQSYVLQAIAAAAAANGNFDRATEITEEALANLDKESEEWEFHNTLLKQFYLREKPYIEPHREQSASKNIMECVAE